jgi:rSAM/selenodomain-associated transferase 1
MIESRKLLLIFVKNPVLGKVKTRLASTMGDEKALNVYNQLLAHTVEVTKNVKADKAVFYSDYIDSNDIWPDNYYQKCLQQGRDLGQRMLQAFKWAFEQQYQQVVIIGSDCPQLTTSLIHQAFESLLSTQVVIGPAADGGYYLLGMRALIPELFIDKVWSSSEIFAVTVADLHRQQILFTELQILHDVDYEEDLFLMDVFKRGH